MKPGMPHHCITQAYGVEPDLTREGGSIPITLKFEEATSAFALLAACRCSVGLMKR